VKIQIKSLDVDVRQVTSKGRTYNFRSQTGFLYVDEEVRKFRVPLGDSQSPYAIGSYVIGEESFSVNEFGDLGIKRLNLSPVGAGVTKVA